uniref:NADH-ubiquinone oxidoreductase chain 4 n=1 Tax=Cichlidogyrus mbirizei TaxID=2094302 RepID=A0A344ANV3_9PLAT|nr:NADH dehydrogenase subunit 4 [Cichlidogyrus mbirizei]
MVLSYVCLLVFVAVAASVQDFVNVGSYISLDFVGCALSFISILLMIFFFIFCGSVIGKLEAVLIGISSIFSVVCFLSNDTMVFWVSYELAIIPLVYSLLLGSPYSERFLAFWYLLGYVCLTSLPLLFSIQYVNFLAHTTNMGFKYGLEGPGGFILGVIMFILFSTKIPLPPFHAWLPIVHAEASTIVSVWLSGFIMKLGIIGMYRFVLPLIQDNSNMITVLIGYSVAILLSCLSELDTKRWLAYLSLGHIVIAVVGLLNSEGVNSEAPIYCLGHGFSASLLFICFLFIYESFGSRSWLAVSLAGRISVGFLLVISTSLLTAASFPPSLNFFAEIFILGLSFHSLNIILAYLFYLLVGGLIPVLILAYLVCSSGESHGNGVPSFGILFSLYIVALSTYVFFMML